MNFVEVTREIFLEMVLILFLQRENFHNGSCGMEID